MEREAQIKAESAAEAESIFENLDEQDREGLTEEILCDLDDVSAIEDCEESAPAD